MTRASSGAQAWEGTSDHPCHLSEPAWTPASSRAYLHWASASIRAYLDSISLLLFSCFCSIRQEPISEKHGNSLHRLRSPCQWSELLKKIAHWRFVNS